MVYEKVAIIVGHRKWKFQEVQRCPEATGGYEDGEFIVPLPQRDSSASKGFFFVSVMFQRNLGWECVTQREHGSIEVNIIRTAPTCLYVFSADQLQALKDRIVDVRLSVDTAKQTRQL